MNWKTYTGAGAFVVLFIGGWLLFASPGEKEFKQMQQAMERVHSWRIVTQISSRGMLAVQRTHEAVCPDQEHIVESSTSTGGAEYIRLKDDVYYRGLRPTWTKGMPGPDLFFPFPTPRPCLSDPGQPSSQPGGGAEEMRLALQHDMDDGSFEKGDLDRVAGASCREWKVLVTTAQNKMGSYTICIGEQDHLPHRIQSLNQDFTIQFEWNVPVMVQAPQMGEP
jgi:hypothetical protein